MYRKLAAVTMIILGSGLFVSSILALISEEDSYYKSTVRIFQLTIGFLVLIWALNKWINNRKAT
jgi:hypothetical protein